MARVKGEFVRELPVNEPVELVVTAGSGDVAVRRGPVGKATVRGTYYVRAVPHSRAERLAELIERRPPVELHGREIRIGDLSRYTVELGPSILGEVFEGIEIDYEIEVPAGTEARINTGSGDIDVAGIAGPLAVRTGSGDVEVADIGGDVEVRTGSGDVDARGIGGELRVGTGSGDVEVEGVRGDAEITTGSGEVEARGIAGDLSVTTGSGDLSLEEVGGDVAARTGSGDVRLESAIAADKTWRLRTGSGDVHLALPADAEFRLIAEAEFGEVHSDFTGSPRAAAAIEVRSGSGDIHIRAKGEHERGDG